MTSKNTAIEIFKTILNVPRWVIEWLTSFIEFLTDHTHQSVGHIMIKASPMLAPTLSMFAIYGTLHNQFGATAAGIMTFVIEAVGFAAVFAKTRIEEHNRNASHVGQRSTKIADRAVVAYFGVSELLILGFEAVPAWLLMSMGGETATGEPATVIYAIRHSVPLLFPIFSYIGANIFSLMDILDNIDSAEEDDHKSQVAELKAEVSRLESKLGESELALNATSDAASDLESEVVSLTNERNKIESERDKLNAELADLQGVLSAVRSESKSYAEQLKSSRSEIEKLSVELAVHKTESSMLADRLSSVSASLERYQEHSLNGPTEQRSNRSTSRSKKAVQRASNSRIERQEPAKDSRFDRRVQLLDLFKRHGEMSLSDASSAINASKSTLSGDLQWFEEVGVIHRSINPETGKTVVTVNGNEPAFRAGKLG